MDIGRECVRERKGWETQKCRVPEGEIAVFCLPATGAREEEATKRRERGCKGTFFLHSVKTYRSFQLYSTHGQHLTHGPG